MLSDTRVDHVRDKSHVIGGSNQEAPYIEAVDAYHKNLDKPSAYNPL